MQISAVLFEVIKLFIRNCCLYIDDKM